MARIVIIGYGWVGRSMKQLFPGAMVHDHNYSDSVTRDKANQADVAFVCVPTPNLVETTLDTTIVRDVVKWCQCPLIVIRSTVNPGTCDALMEETDKWIAYQPEYLGETVDHPMINPKERRFLIIGGHPKQRRDLINLYQEAYNANISIRQMSCLEAEVVKLTENRAIAFKVAQCQELYDVCEKARVDYYTIRDAVYGDDPRFNLWWTFVYPEKRGFNSKCIPKDVYAWAAWAESVGYDPVITRSILERNKAWLAL